MTNSPEGMHAAANECRNHRVDREWTGCLGKRPKSGEERWKGKTVREQGREETERSNERGCLNEASGKDEEGGRGPARLKGKSATSSIGKKDLASQTG